MFDLSRITDTLSGLFGSAAGAGDGGLLEQLQNSGLDPSALTGLTEGEIMQLLADYGIDPAQIGDGLIATLLSNAGIEDPAGFAASLFGDGDPRA